MFNDIYEEHITVSQEKNNFDINRMNMYYNDENDFRMRYCKLVISFNCTTKSDSLGLLESLSQ